jgi:DNA-binding response OmpR family regulator
MRLSSQATKIYCPAENIAWNAKPPPYVVGSADCGYKVLAAAGPGEGLALCRAHQPEIQLLVTDVILPRMKGPQLAEQVKQISPRIRVLYVSGYTSNAIAHYGVLDAGLWFLGKPFSVSELVAKVREVLDAERPEAGRETTV